MKLKDFGRMLLRGITVRGPVGWLKCAALLLLLFGVVHLLGWRDDMAFLTGTASTTGSRAAMAYRGVAYGLAYTCAVMVSPILILGAGIWAVLGRMRLFKT